MTEGEKCLNILFWNVFEILIDFIESFIVLRFVSKIQGFKVKKHKTIFLISTILFSLELIMINNMVHFEGLAIFFPIFTLCLYSYLFLKGSFLEKLFLSFSTILSIIIINSTTAILTNIIFKVTIKELIFNKNIFRFAIIILTKIIFFTITQAILKFKKSYVHYDLEKKEWILLLFSPIISIFFCSQIIEIALDIGLTGQKLYNFLIFTLCIIIVNFLNYYLFFKITSNRKTKEELKFLKYQLNYEQKSMNNIKSTYNELQMLRHDMKNNIFCISALLEQKEYEKAYEYLNNLSGKIVKTKTFATTNNKAIDCILNLKIQSAIKENIKFTYNVDNNIKTTNEVDFCILLANLLDNAIEACQNINNKSKSINLKISNGNFINIVVKNTIEDSVLQNNPNLKTIKSNSKNHGFGTLSIKNIVEKYNGYINYYERNGNFYCQTFLPKI